MALTPKQEAFCLAYLKTGNASEAYRQAYSAANMKPETINNKASDLLKKGEIGVRLEQLNQSAVTDSVMT
ncbi:terminase small subunit, partial [Pseudomonas protegens]